MAGGPSTLPGAAPLRGGTTGGAGGTAPVSLQPTDFQAFERALAAIQDAYSREDVAALSRFMTGEMAGRLSADLAANQQRGLRNDVSGTRLLQGDLSEAWREGATTYATVAMRFSAIDVMIERSSGRVVSGDPVRPVEATELWTFRREGFGAWILSGIQQAN
jgi:predicted lipid-binding transport protein (Tim44 family)